MLTYFINCAGKGLSSDRRAELEKSEDFAIEPNQTTAASRSGMIRKLASGEYRLYSRKKNAKTGKRHNLGTFKSRQEAEQHEREIQFFKRH